MQEATPPSRIDAIFDLGLAAALALAWGFWANAWGLEVAPDGAKYMEQAARVADSGFQFVSAQWPPLYPFAMGPWIFLDALPVRAAFFVSFLSIVASLAFSFRILRQFGAGKIAILGAAAIFATHVGILEYHLTIVSEPLFCAFLLGSLDFALRHFQSGRISHYLGATILVSCAALTRYFGYYLIGFFACYSLFWFWKNRKEMGVSRKASFWAIHSLSYLPSLGLVLYNWNRWGMPWGERAPSKTSFWENCQLTWATLANNAPGLGLAALLGSALVVGLIARNRGKRFRESFSSFGVLFLLVNAAFYVALTLYSSSTAQLDPINARHYTGFFFLLGLIAMGSLLFLGKQLEPRKACMTKGAVFTLVLASQIPSFASLQANPAFFLAKGGHTDPVKDLGHTELGFYAKDDFRELQDVLKNLFAKENRVEVAVLYDRRGRSLLNIARSLFFDPAIYPEGFSCHLARYRYAEYSVECWTDGKKRTLRYWTVRGNENAEIVASLREVLAKVPRLFLFQFHGLYSADHRLDGKNAEGLEIREVAAMKSYKIFEVSIEK